jgi:hypothetical protein
MNHYEIVHITQDSGPLGIERGHYVRVNGVLVGPACASREEAEKKLRERHDLAFRFCAELFRETRGKPLASCEMADIAKRASIEANEARNLVLKAQAEGLLMKSGDRVWLTEAGRRAAG